MTGGLKLDAYRGRVTVFVNDDDIIQSIEMEIEVGLPDGIKNGNELDIKLEELQNEK